MTYQEIITYFIIAFTYLLVAVRLIGFKNGKVLKRYTVGSSMTIGNRQIQEDQSGICQTADGLLAVLADGIGKNYGGKIAGKLAVDTIKQFFLEYRSFENPIYFFKKAFHCANHEIRKELEDRDGAASVAAVVLQEGLLYYALAGNVKVAVYRNGNLVQVSTGHTVDKLAKESYVRGAITREDALDLLDNKRIYNYLGQDSFQDLEYFDTPVKLKRGDIVVLMSDGVYETITWKEIEECLKLKKKCQAKAFEVIERVNTNSRQNKDNASIVLIEQT